MVARQRQLLQHKAWALAARIVFALAPNSASCERAFALLKNLFGEQQMSALADYVQACRSCSTTSAARWARD